MSTDEFHRFLKACADPKWSAEQITSGFHGLLHSTQSIPDSPVKSAYLRRCAGAHAKAIQSRLFQGSHP